MSSRLAVSYARFHAKVVEYPQKLDRPSQWTLIRPLKLSGPVCSSIEKIKR